MSKKERKKKLTLVCKQAIRFIKKLIEILLNVLSWPFKMIYRFFKWVGKVSRKTSKKVWGILDFRGFEKRKKVYFFVNIVAGMGIIFFMHLVEFTQFGENALNNAFDVFIRIDADKAAKTTKTTLDTGPISLVDLDHDNPANPNKEKFSYLSPRLPIAGVIEMACGGGAGIVVVDILLEVKDCNFPGQDEALRKVLESIPADKNFKTKIIFAARGGTGKNLIPNLFDELIDKNPNFYRASPTVYTSRTDRVVRYWQVYEKYGKNKMNWSIPVLTLALYRESIEELKRVEKELLQEKNKNGFLEIDPGSRGDGKFIIPLSGDDLYRQRIRYSLIPKDCLTHKPAGNLILPSMISLSPKRFENKIVIIGSSDPAKGDRHPTPIGSMPGMYIQANTIYTLLAGQQSNPAPGWLTIIIDILLIIMAAYFFHYLNSFVAKSLGGVFIAGVLGFLSYFIFFRYYGVFLNLAFGVMMIGYLETMVTLREIFIEKRFKNR
ncbi:MAG: CHASE2 domain-containing protein [Candidatus Aminicenantes bacterium]|nr:CHASE2 domain-containing protein [Candidatus Aminicenantes bacterium]